MKRPNPERPTDLTLALSAARAALGSDGAVERVRAGVLAKIASGGSPPTPASVGGAWLGKSLGALLLCAGAGVLLYSREQQPPSAASAPELPGPVIEALAPVPAQPAPSTASEASLAVQAKPPAAAPRASAKRDRSRVVPPPAASVRAPCADAALEVDLVSRAQELLRAQPKAALELLTEHAQRFGCGVLALERDSLRIDAERALGLDEQADQHARELIAHYPESMEARALKRRIERAAASGEEHKNEAVGLPTP